MTYQVLARKWRPRNFKEMAGQTHVLRTLINALDTGRLHHAYLFTGTRGVGKTTIARILARCLNCELGVTSTPCGECGACREISEGRFLDLIEVDAASRTKVEDTRELLENVQYAPSRGRYKVYLIDEVHMLSAHSFNALLKTLEEPPPHVKFLLATTDPQKLPITVLSRCLQFNLKNLTPERLVEHMKHILGEERIPFEEGALWQLGRAAQGSVRDCLTLLDQAIGFCDGKVTDEGVREFLGNIDRTIIIQLMDALVAQDAAAVLQQIATVAEHSPDFAVILQELISWLHRVAIAQVVPDAIDNSQGDRADVLAHAAALTAETVQLYYQIALKGREDLPYALDPRSGLEMTLLRMLAFMPAGIPKVPGERLQARTAPAAAAEAAPRKKPLAEDAPRAPAAARATSAAEPLHEMPAAVSAPGKAREPQTRAERPGPAAEAVARPPARIAEELAVPAPAGPPASAPDMANVSEPPPAQLADETRIALADLRPEHWIAVYRQLTLTGVSRSIASHCVLLDVSGNRLRLQLEETQAVLFNDEHRKRIEAALTAYCGIAIELAMEVGKVATETPAAWRARRENERRQEAVRTFTEDPLVQAVVERFGGSIQYDSITPLTPSP